MNWRPWIIASLLFACAFLNGALLFFERVPVPEGSADMKDDSKDPLLALRYLPSKRVENFKAMGMDDELVAATTQRTKAIDKRAEFNKQLLTDHFDEVGPMLCPGKGLPQRYAALGFLVDDENDSRVVVPYDRLTFLEVKPWWQSSMVAQVYAALEPVKGRKVDATVMGVSSVLTRQEEKVLESEEPFNHQGIGGFGWSFGGLEKRNPEVRRKLIEYFALMHVFVEIANEPGGLCE